MTILRVYFGMLVVVCAGALLFAVWELVKEWFKEKKEIPPPDPAAAAAAAQNPFKYAGFWFANSIIWGTTLGSILVAYIEISDSILNDCLLYPLTCR